LIGYFQADAATALLSDPALLAAVNEAAATGSDVVLPDGTTLPASMVLALLQALSSNAAAVEPQAASLPVESVPMPVEAAPVPAASTTVPSYSQQPRIRIPLPRTRFAMMSHSDMEFVLRSQLMQLQSKNPMNDDFYFQVINARKGGRYRGSGFPLAASTNKANPFRNTDGTPSMTD
jgi:hypothetical protein